MSVAVACNLSDGLVLGVDSAVTLTHAGDVLKVFDNAGKLFQLQGSRVGVATFGLASLKGRTIGSFVREFETKVEHQEMLCTAPISEVVEALRAFFVRQYVEHVEALAAASADPAPLDNELPSLGFVAGGFSPGEFLSEVWQIDVPGHEQPGSCSLLFGPGACGCYSFATNEPLNRYFYGYSAGLVYDLADYAGSLLGRPLSAEEEGEMFRIAERQHYPVLFDSMPIQVGIKWVRFLTDLAIAHHYFASAHPVVGGKAKIGVVTYRQEDFRLIE